MIEKEEKSEKEEFIERLKKANKSDIAILKRASGSSIAESRQAMGIFYKLLPRALTYQKDEEMFFLIATLFGFNQNAFSGNFGETMKLVKIRSKSESLDKRFLALLDTYRGFNETWSAFSFKLRQLINLASSKEVGIDWVSLLKDLSYWTHPDKFIQKKWARSYFFIEKI